ncbi:ABC transporter permease [Kamptonema cortianum]|nr:ABC transporter permease [Kamptonema cortianum]
MRTGARGSCRAFSSPRFTLWPSWGGKVLGGAILALMQAVLFCVFAPMAGVTIAPAQIAPLVGALFLTGIGLTALGYVIAWPMDSTMGFHAIMNVFLIPLWLLSGALFPPSGSATWIGWIIHLNPLYYALSAVRHFLGSAPPEGIALPSLGLSLTVTALSTIVLLIICVWMTLKINRKM